MQTDIQIESSGARLRECDHGNMPVRTQAALDHKGQGDERLAGMDALKARILEASRADVIPEGESGLWTVKKLRIARPMRVSRGGEKTVLVPPGVYTQLYRLTTETMHLLGELVMHDFPDELNTHLGFMLAARGRVLITGLGLGCCVRGCLANPAVESVAVIERDPAVLALVAPWISDPRVTIHEADAVEWCRRRRDVMSFTCAWHDLWSDPDAQERHLQRTHSELILHCASGTEFQGAWQLPRWYRRLCRRNGSKHIL